jgi:hypothetical protein
MKYKLEYTGIFPTDDDILISCSIFKLKNSYKDFSKYIDGLKLLIDTTISNNMKMIIFYDHSMDSDNDFKQIIDKYKTKILFCSYRFDDIIDDDGYHKGVFGTFVRFMPIFLTEIRYKCLFVSDIDYPIYEIKIHIMYLINKFIGTKYDFNVIYKIGYEYSYNNCYSIPNTTLCVFFNFYSKKKYYEFENIFFDFLNKLNINDDTLLDIINKKIETTDSFYKKNDITMTNENKIIKRKDNNMFSYGVDELFLNTIIMPYLIKSKEKMSVIYMYDVLRDYIQNILNNDKIDDSIYKQMYYNIIDKNLIGFSKEDDKKLMESKKYFKYKMRYSGISYNKYDKYNKEHLNKILYIISQSVGENENRLKNHYQIIQNFIKEVMKMYKKYPNLKKNVHKWILNFKLHKKKGIIRKKEMINYIIKNDLLKFYNFNKLLKKKSI